MIAYGSAVDFDLPRKRLFAGVYAAVLVGKGKEGQKDLNPQIKRFEVV